MYNRLKHLFVMAVLVVGVAACRTSPVYNVDNAEFASTAPSLEAAEKAIKLAGASLGWATKAESPGHLVATLPIRTHLAVVDIRHDTKTFSIAYKDSNNLNYDGTEIHSNYNGWIQNLRQAIIARSSTY